MVNGNTVSNYPSNSSEEIKIKDIVFTKVRVKDAGAGNIYDNIKYSTYQNGECFEILTILD